MNASTDSRQGHNIVPKGQNDKVLKTLIQIKRKYYIDYIVRHSNTLNLTSEYIIIGHESRDFCLLLWPQNCSKLF